jgi:hypothetical protein
VVGLRRTVAVEHDVEMRARSACVWSRRFRTFFFFFLVFSRTLGAMASSM